MNNENRMPLTLTESCTLLARETVSLLEGSDLLPASAVSLRNALALICGEQGSELLAWVDAEMENTKRFVETGTQTMPLVKLDAPLPLPDPDMQLDSICILLKAAAQRRPSQEQWDAMLDAVKVLTEMDDLHGMVLDAKVPEGGFLSAQELRTLLDSVRNTIHANRQRAGVRPCEADGLKDEALAPEKL